MIKTQANRLFLLSLVFIHLCFFTWQLFHSNYYLRDSYEYLNAAANLKSRFLLYAGDLAQPINFYLFTKRPPAYPVFLLVLQWISTSPVWVIIVQNLLSIAGIYLFRQLLVKFGYATRYDFIFLLLLVFTPSHFIYANLIMSETLFQFLLILACWYLVKYLAEGSGTNGLWYSLILTLCVFTKPVFIFMIALNALFWLVYSIRKSTFKPVLLSLIPLLFLLTYQYRNYRQTHVFEVSSITTINLVDYNTYFYLVKTQGKQRADSTISAIDGISKQKAGFAGEVKYKKQMAVHILLKNPLGYTLFHLKGVAGFFLDPGRFDLVNFLQIPSGGEDGLLYQLNQGGIKGALGFMLKHTWGLLFIIATVLLVNLIKLILFVFFVFQRRVNIQIKGIIVLTILYIALLTGPLGASRFMMPVIPFYIGGCLLFVSGLKGFKINRMLKRFSPSH